MSSYIHSKLPRELLLETLHPTLPSSSFVSVGDVVASDADDGVLRGHGTQVVGGDLVATTCGVVERVNKLVTVHTLRNRYAAEVGDVVVGRVSEVHGKRWLVDLRGKAEAVLQLSAVNLPGGVQRRRTAEDELNMRAVFREGDLITAEVQSVRHDGTVLLHTRSLKYGRLEAGQAVDVPPNLVKRQRQHFQKLPDIGIDIVLGCNGTVWLTPHQPESTSEQPDFEQQHAAAAAAAAALTPEQQRQQRLCVARASQAVKALAQLYLPVHPAAVRQLAALAVHAGCAVPAMLEPEFLRQVVQQEAEARKDHMEEE